MDVVMYKDFVPVQSAAPGIFNTAIIEDLQEQLVQLNEWKLKNPNIKILNIETVTLPNIHRSGESGSEDTSLKVRGDNSSYWHQFIRLWYFLPTGS